MCRTIKRISKVSTASHFTCARQSPHERPTNRELFSILPDTRGAGRLLFLDEFALDHDLDLVADDKLAIEHHVERQAVVLPVDLALGAVADAVAHHGVVEFPILDHV